MRHSTHVPRFRDSLTYRCLTYLVSKGGRFIFFNGPLGVMGLAVWLVLLMGLGIGPRFAAAQQIEFVEKFVLAVDRQAALSQLTPGSDEFYFFSALDKQLGEQHADVERLLKSWADNLGETELYQRIKTRDALLRYQENPQQSLDYLIRQLELRFDHQREVPATEQKLPSEFPAEALDIEALLKRELGGKPQTQRIEDAGLELLTERFDSLTPTQQRHLLSRLKHPNLTKLVDWLAADLERQPNPTQFGSMPIHAQLTIEQMDRLARSVTSLRNNATFVQLYLRKLKPSADENTLVDSALMRSYLETAWNFIAELDGSQNSLKANILFHLLRADLHAGKPSLDRFKRYLELPRPVHYVLRDILQSEMGRLYPCNLVDDFSGVIGLPPVHNEWNIVSKYLHQFLRDANSPEEFAKYLEDEFLNKEFARIKILNGMGDWDRWSKILTPAEYKEVVDRVEIEFAETNPTLFAPDAAISLDVDIKNANDLVIKVFEINVENYLRQFGRHVDTNINLDGLIPNWQQTRKLDQAPAIRQRHSFAFPELAHPGIYVIDFIGNGQSCRALVQKGRLSVTQRVTAVGHVFCVFDDEGQQLNGATASLGTRRFTADEDGFILVPFSTSPGDANLIVQHGSLATLTRFQHLAETYELQAGIYLDREQLLKNSRAECVIRPVLKIAGMPIDIEGRLSDVVVTVSTTNHEGQKSQRTFSSVELDSQGELVIPFQVPPRLSKVDVTLSAKVRNHSQDRDDHLSVTQSQTINQIDQSEEIADVHLLKDGDQFVLEILGLTGEARTQQVVQVSLKHAWFQQPISEFLQSDETGRIRLGTLDNIDKVTAGVKGGTLRTWTLSSLDQNTSFQTVTSSEGQPIVCAIPSGLTAGQRVDVSLYELRDGLIAQNVTDKVKRDDSHVMITGLSAGDYRLHFGESNESIQISVTKGKQVGSYYVGLHRILETTWATPLVFGKPTVENEQLQLQVRGANSQTRLHVFATRYVPRFDPFSRLQRGGPLEPVLYRRGTNFNTYVSGRVIGDEFRYVIDRRNAAKFPGNMLERPSLLLAPWSLGPTENLEQRLQESAEFDAAAARAPESRSREMQQAAPGGDQADFANLDFLIDEAVVLTNLRPDEEGILRIDLAELKDKTHLTIVAIDHRGTMQRTLTMPAKKLVVRDLRLLNSFESDQSVAQRKTIKIIPANHPFQVNNILTAKFQSFADLKSVFRLYEGLPKGSALSEWRFLLDWPELDDKKRLELYGKYACHELNFYVWKKDRPFFDKHIRPFLKNKFQKTFIDRWLLEESLAQYLEPQQFAKLNVFEKVLLAERAGERRADILKHLSDQLELRPLNQQWLDALFDKAIASSSLDESELSKQIQTKNAARQLAADRADDARRLGGEVDLAEAVLFERSHSEIRGRVSRSGKAGEESDESGRRLAKAEELSGGELLKALEGQEATDMEAQGLIGRYLGPASVTGRLYRQVAPTEEWVESNYYRLHPQNSSTDLIPVNDFWVQWARSNKQEPFLSIHFAQATESFREMLLALAVLDLPVSAEEPTVEFTDNSLEWKMETASLMVHQQLKPTPKADGAATILISENIFQLNDRHRVDQGLQYDKFLSGPFATHTLYGGQVVITNPTSTPRVIELLTQVPEGAIATSISQQTKTVKLVLAAFQSQNFEYRFYFPKAGIFQHFPAHVADQDQVVAVAPPREFEVRDDLVAVDKTTWDFVSQSGTDEEILAFLRDKNLHNIELSRIAFRMKDQAFFQKAIELLRQRCAYDHQLWSYSLRHNDPEAILEYLAQEPKILTRAGHFVNSPILKIDDFASSDYDHREYWPLINIRAHQVRREREILNERIHGQYHRLLHYLADKPEYSMSDQLSMIYYLLLQDRVAESLERFASLRRDDTDCAMQYDYLDAYLKFYLADVDKAEQIALRYADYSIPRWRDRFAAIRQQVAEIRGEASQIVNADNAAQVQDQLAAQAPNFEFEIIENTIKIDYQNLEQLEVNYYLMDAELLFSTNPFDALNVQSFSMIRPNQSETKTLAADQKQLLFDLPDNLLNRNLLVEIRAGDRVESKPVYSSALKVQVIESFGQVLVTDAKTGKPLPKTYVKVYAQLANGQAKFYKDGYTDLRGRFDYASQNNQPTAGIQRTALLIQHDDLGTVIREANLPQQ